MSPKTASVSSNVDILVVISRADHYVRVVRNIALAPLSEYKPPIFDRVEAPCIETPASPFLR
jgi:hypothetical protein